MSKKYSRAIRWLLLFLLVSFASALPLSFGAIELSSRYTWVKETARNSSPQIDAWEKPFGFRNLPWCMVFAYTMEDYAAKIEGYKNPLKKVGSCAAQLSYARMKFSGLRVIPSGGYFRKPTVSPGWLAISSHLGTRVDLIGGSWPGHVVRVVRDLGDEIEYVAGNERNQVRFGKVKKSKILAFVAPSHSGVEQR